MAEPSLLCVSCGAAPPPHRRTWNRCTICVARNLPSTYYCGEECMNAHWPKHQQYHMEQKQQAKQHREGTFLERDRSAVDEQALDAEETGDEFSKRCAEAMALGVEDLHAGAKAWRKIIKELPDQPSPYHNLAIVLARSGRWAEAAPMFLKSMELDEDCTEDWALSAACAFDVLITDDCCEVPKPEWWNDEGLKALSARVVALAPNSGDACSMRGCVLSGNALSKAPWNAGPRTAAEIKEAATWYRRGAMATRIAAEKLRLEGLASRCDAVADPLLAKQEAEAAEARAVAEAEAAKARAVAEAEAAEALKAAEAKAAAAAEELLAEEEEEKQVASTKANNTKQGKGKKGKGKR